MAFIFYLYSQLWRLNGGDVYSRAAFIQGQRLFKGGVYLRAAFIFYLYSHLQRLNGGGVYSRAAFN